MSSSGTLTSTGAGKINVGGGNAILDASASAVTLGGLLQVANTRTLTVGGAVTSTGKIDLFAGKLIVAAAGITLSGAGQVNLNNSASNIIVGATTGATLTNVSDRIAGAGHLGDGSMVLVNHKQAGSSSATADRGPDHQHGSQHHRQCRPDRKRGQRRHDDPERGPGCFTGVLIGGHRRYVHPWPGR